MINNNIKDVLKQIAPLECELVGEANLDDLVKGDVEFQREKEGYNMDFFEVLTHLATIITLIKEVHGAYEKYANTKTSSDLRQTILLKIENNGSIEGMEINKDQLVSIILNEQA